MPRLAGLQTPVALAAITGAGLLIRAIPVVAADFPVNDGGLFVAMVRAIQDAAWTIPTTVAWNGVDLPFAYPPLAFYVVGLLESVLGFDLLSVFRWLPFPTSAMIVPAVYLLGRALLRSDLGGLVAALAYALAPSSYGWLIQGGGVTRAPGLLLAVLALWQIVILVRAPDRRRAAGVGLLAGLTALVHPAAAVFLAVSAVLIWLFEGRARRSLAAGMVAAVVALLVVAPWLLLVVSRHGPGAFLDLPSNGPSLGGAILALAAGRVTGQPFIAPLAVVGVAVALLCVVRRKFLLPIWLLAATALSYQYAMIPFSALIGVVAVDLATVRAASANREATGVIGAHAWIPIVGAAVLAGCLIIEGAASVMAVSNPGAPLHALSSDRRAEMAWVAAELEPSARVAVITNSGWAGDPDSEWFPLLAERRSVATVQGSEWLGQLAFEEQVRAHRSLQACVVPASVSCVRQWLAEWPADYLYLPKGQLHGSNSPADCCPGLRASLFSDPSFTPVYDGDGATIFRVGDPPAGT